MGKGEQSFVFGVAVSGYNFIGREEESRQLHMNFTEGVNTILISPRRWGKTSLVKHVLSSLDTSNVIPVYVDIFGCKTEYEFYNTLTEAVLKQTASKLDLWMENARDFLARLTPKISISPDANSEFALSLGITEKTHTPQEVLQLAEAIAERRNKRIIICIDEFQQIGEMEDSISIQKRLRTVWQHQKLVSYCLFGSKKHMMINIFQNKKMPLYQFGQMMYLQKISIEKWTEYIVSHFAQRTRTISEEQATEICKRVDCYSSYVQQLSWHIFSLLDNGDTATDAHIERGVQSLLDSCEMLFIQQVAPLTNYQMNFLRAISSGIHKGFGDHNIRETFSLGSPSNISRLKTALVEKELIESDGNDIHITDPVFEYWFKKRFCKMK